MASDVYEPSGDAIIGGELSAFFSIDWTQSLSFCIRSYIYGMLDRDFRHRLSSITNWVADTRASCA